MKFKEIKGIIKELKETADVEKTCSLYKELLKVPDNNGRDKRLAHHFKIWANNWLAAPLTHLEERINELIFFHCSRKNCIKRITFKP